MTDKTTSKGVNWGKFGGSNKMFGWTGSGTQTPGQSSQEGDGPKTGFAAKGGGNDPLSTRGEGNKDYAGTQEAGRSASCKAGPNNKFAEGGKTHMHGNTGSRPAIAGQSSQ